MKGRFVYPRLVKAEEICDLHDQKCLEKKFSRSQTSTVNLHRIILIERKETSKNGNTKTPEHLSAK